MEATAVLDLNDVRVFAIAAKAGTVQAAAKLLSVPPSTVSRSLTRLENQLQLQLLRRSTRGIALTEAGQEYLKQCDTGLEQLREAQDVLDLYRTHPHGTLRLGLPVTFAREALAPMLRLFVSKHPNIRLQIVLSTCDPIDPLLDRLDLLLQTGKPPVSSFRMKAFPPIPQCLYASPIYFKGRELPKKPQSLRDHASIGYAPSGTAVWHLVRGGTSQRIEVPLHISVADPMIQKQLALDALGIAQLPVWAAKPEVQIGRLVAVLPGWQAEPLQFHALYAERAARTPKIKLFLDFIQQFIATEYDPRSRPSRI